VQKRDVLRLRPAGFVEDKRELDDVPRPEIVERVAEAFINRPRRKEHLLIDKIGADEAIPAPMQSNDPPRHVRCPCHATATLGASSI